MSDDKKTEKPLENPKVDVVVKPKDANTPDQKRTFDKTAETVKKKIRENVEKTIKENESEGKDKQFKAVEKEVKKAGESVSPNHIKEIEVNVSGKDGDGDTEKRGYTVKPKEGRPKP